MVVDGVCVCAIAQFGHCAVIAVNTGATVCKGTPQFSPSQQHRDSSGANSQPQCAYPFRGKAQ